MRVSSFKAQYRQAPARSVTPPPPAYEPISPVLAPSDLPAAAPSSAKDNITQEGHDASSPALQERSGNGRRENTSLRLSPSPATSEKPFQAASLPPSNVYQPPALRSPIETLANAAVSTFDTKSVYAEHSRRPSQTPFFSPAAATSRPGPSEHAPQHAYPEPSSAYSERPSKRARSEHFPQSARPATSHNPGWSYNVEQMADRGVGTYQLDAAASYHQQESQMKRLSDAELLLNFAISAPYSLQNSHSPTAKRWSFSHAQTLQQQSAPQPNGVQPAVHYKDLKVDNAAPSDRRYSLHSADAGANSAGVSNPIRPPVQIHTPPEDPLGAPVPISTGVPNDPEKKLKKSQGWPKGKPRGSRNGTTTERKRKPVIKQGHIPANVSNGAPSAAQLHSPQSPLADGQEGHQYGNAGLSVPSAQAPAALQRRRLSYPYAAESDMRVSTAESRSPRAHSVPPPTAMAATPLSDDAINFDTARSHDASQVTICAGCHSTDSLTSIGDGEQWISCDGCKEWFHYACVGFKSEREVRVIDKFYCEGCRPKFGNTTKLRKSNRAHTAVDYAGLNEGIMKTSDDNPEHHYIQAFKNGDLKFTPETFARLPPECVTADFIEKMNGFEEPVVIPAALNPRPSYPPTDTSTSLPLENEQSKSENPEQFAYDLVPDDGQDKIDMVIPRGLTVRRVAELYGPAETVPVIDVKAQEGEDKRWTMAKWADYYEQEGEKPVRNVISLEVSRSKLGRLIRRPKVVRDMDLQDSVWPEDDKRNAPPVQFYCLMSVADCYTDFHIDFGGSSVYYHIIKGRKTFFFIPPTKQNLKKYEDWCLSPSQSHDFLGLRVKECYRVDLYPGDTMLIPSGWIHAVWTPEDSLVIGGNYLTRIHYGMQIKVLEIEKNTKVAARFRYPFFQKIMWLAVIKYLEEDPLPLSVEELLLSGSKFERELPIYCEPDKFGHNSDLGPENYNQRYYSKAELDGLPDLQNYIWRSVMISQGKIEGITQQTRNAVTRSIPKSHGEPSIIARKFAMWAAWKRGNEHIPQWALADGTLPEDKKLTAAQTKIERESWNETLKLVRGGERHSSLRARVSESSVNGERSSQAGPPVTGFLRPHREHVTTPKTSQLGPKRIACDACRKRRIRCKHKDELVESPQSSASGSNGVHIPQSSSPVASLGDGITRRYSDADIPTGPLPYPRYDLQATMNGGPVTTDPIVDALGSKSGRVKACADCRKSKRRCIHDEHGNVDPVKAAEAPVPRGSASKRRRIEDDDGEALTKKIKMESFAGLVDGEVSHWNRYPLQKTRPASASGSREVMVTDPALVSAWASHEGGMPIDPQLADPDRTCAIATTPPPGRKESIVTSIEDAVGEPMEGVIESRPRDPEPRTPAPAENRNTGQRNGYHTGSPPQASHSRKAVGTRPNSMSPNWSRPAKGISRSGGKTTTPKAPGGRGRRDSKETVKQEPKSEQKPRAAPSGTGKKSEDMASIALALQLQMEEHGLRRRSK